MTGSMYFNVLLVLLFLFIVTGFRVLTAPEKTERHKTSKGEEVTHAHLEKCEVSAIYVCSVLMSLSVLFGLLMLLYLGIYNPEVIRLAVSEFMYNIRSGIKA